MEEVSRLFATFDDVTRADRACVRTYVCLLRVRASCHDSSPLFCVVQPLVELW